MARTLVPACLLALAALATQAAGKPRNPLIGSVPKNTSRFPAKFDPVEGVGASVKFASKLGASSWSDVALPSTLITCFVDPETGVVVGLNDGKAPGGRCGPEFTGATHEVEVPLPNSKYVQKVTVVTLPKSDMIAKLVFEIADVNNATSKLAPGSTTIVTCGHAAGGVPGEAGSGAVFDAALFNAQRVWKALNSTGGTKNVTAAAQLKFSGPHLAATRVGNCLTGRAAAPLVFNTTGDDAIKQKLTAVANTVAAPLAKFKPAVALNSTIAAKSFDPVFSPQTCKTPVYCPPSANVTIDDTGCQPEAVGNRWVIVADGIPVEVLPCDDPNVRGTIAYQQLTPQDAPDCILTETCLLPPLAAEIVGAQCESDDGVVSPCYPSSCPAGEVQIPNTGTCVAGDGVCCASPQCAVPLQSCGGACVDLMSDVNNCGECGVTCPATAVCSAGECICPDGQPVAIAASWPQGVLHDGFEAVETFNLGAAVNGPNYINPANSCTPGSASCYCTLRTNAYKIPDRFTVRAGGVCGPLVWDTGFQGNTTRGCAASAPCCTAAAGGSCSAAPNIPCPPGTSSGDNGVYQGGGIGYIKSTWQQTDRNALLYVSAYGVCGGTENDFSLTCCSDIMFAAEGKCLTPAGT